MTFKRWTALFMSFAFFILFVGCIADPTTSESTQTTTLTQTDDSTQTTTTAPITVTETSSTTLPTTTTEITTQPPANCDVSPDAVDDRCRSFFQPGFGFIPDETKTNVDLADTLLLLDTWMAPYEITQFDDYVSQYEDQYVVDIMSLDPSEYADHYLYPEDVLNIPVFDAQFSQTTLFYDDILYLVTLLNEPYLSLGAIQTYEGTYYIRECCSRFGSYGSETSADVSVVVMLADHQLYADVWRYTDKGVLENRTMFLVGWDDEGILSFQKYGFDSLPDEISSLNAYDYVDYNRDTSGIFVHFENITYGIKTLSVFITDNQGGYVGYQYSGDNQRLSATIVNAAEETYFWSIYGDTVDYRQLLLYQDGVFQVSYRMYYMTDSQTYLALNNYLNYNLRYVENWDYYFARFLYENETQVNSNYEGFGVNIWPLKPEVTQTLRFEIDTAITRELYEAPLFTFAYNNIPYDTFITQWDSYTGFWDTTYMEGSTFYTPTLTLHLSYGAQVVLDSLTGGVINTFYEDIESVYPSVI